MELVDVATASPDVLATAVEAELASQHRLLPHRRDYAALLGHGEEIARLVKGRASLGTPPDLGDVVFAQKDVSGSRPLTVMGLLDAVAYRHLCNLLAPRLPETVTRRTPSAEFKRALIEEAERAQPGETPLSHIAVTDVTAYYEFVDHGLLADELVAQTGDEPIVDQLLTLAAGVMGRSVGIPQIHASSDVLGDVYIDRVRRQMRRRGFKTVTYSDDFRIGAPSLSEARRALELCAFEMRHLGLVMNERKTFTYSLQSYRDDLDKFARAERELFVGAEELQNFWVDTYAGEEAIAQPTSLAADPLSGNDDEESAAFVATAGELREIDATPVLMDAAERALAKWVEADRSTETRSRTSVAITQSLLGRALPILGASGSPTVLDHAIGILASAPSLTPQLADYLIRYSQGGPDHRTKVRDLLDNVVTSSILSDWQAIWIAHVASYQRGSGLARRHVLWLRECIETKPDAVAAHAAAALGNIGRGDGEDLVTALGRIGPTWRSLALWGLARVSTALAQEVAEDGVDRVMVGGTAPRKGKPTRVRRGHARP
ncbi:hypothetical protein [Cellulomonas sp. HD19AZ1]|uniref:hypothetical protein n=1 Tax=Cellulomonas sp. HD19AZ1 TaxID=2559593 RepID=UPI00107099F9|nr:hypothetical protein [Cellulomonas sp. HD19AZ1]TFH70620.1 hypothetical protein E4A51_12750 [Cellulomonas sp. HD19AZ1]